MTIPGPHRSRVGVASSASNHLMAGFQSPQPPSPSGLWLPLPVLPHMGSQHHPLPQLFFWGGGVEKKGKTEGDATLSELPKSLEPQPFHL